MPRGRDGRPSLFPDEKRDKAKHGGYITQQAQRKAVELREDLFSQGDLEPPDQHCAQRGSNARAKMPAAAHRSASRAVKRRAQHSNTVNARAQATGCALPGRTADADWLTGLQENFSACRPAWDDAVCAAPWPRSGGYARASHQTACRLLPACDRYSFQYRTACEAPWPPWG